MYIDTSLGCSVNDLGRITLKFRSPKSKRKPSPKTGPMVFGPVARVKPKSKPKKSTADKTAEVLAKRLPASIKKIYDEYIKRGMSPSKAYSNAKRVAAQRAKAAKRVAKPARKRVQAYAPVKRVARSKPKPLKPATPTLAKRPAVKPAPKGVPEDKRLYDSYIKRGMTPKEAIRAIGARKQALARAAKLKAAQAAAVTRQVVPPTITAPAAVEAAIKRAAAPSAVEPAPPAIEPEPPDFEPDTERVELAPQAMIEAEEALVAEPEKKLPKWALPVGVGVAGVALYFLVIRKR